MYDNIRISIWSNAMKAIVAGRGRVTIPKAVRDKLGIRQGTTLDFEASNDTLVARKAETDPVSSVFGCLGQCVDSDKFLRKIRGGADA